jgi:hypothetical protein
LCKSFTCLFPFEAYGQLGHSSVVLEGGIYVSHIVWRIRYRKLRKEAKMSGVSIDDLLDLRNDREDIRDTRIGVLDPGDIEKQQLSLPKPERVSRADAKC